MARSNTKKNRHILLKLIALLLLCVIAYGGWMYLSALHVISLLNQAEQSYQTMQAKIEDQDYEAAITSVREAAATSDEIAQSLDDIQWVIAEKIPVLGTDVRTARSLSDISHTFSSEGVLPVLDAWDALASDGVFVNDQIDFDKLAGKVDQLAVLVDALRNASTVTDSCAAQLDALPTSHFDDVNRGIKVMKEAVGSTRTALDDLSGALALMGGASDLLSGLMSLGSGASATTQG